MRDRSLSAPARHTIVAPDRVPTREGMVVFLSGSKRLGRWTLPRTMRVAAVMGSVELDLREAEMGEGVSEIEVLAVFGSVEVFVPVGVRVECVGQSLVGSFEMRLSGVPDFPPGAPTVRIKGSAYFSSVEVVVKPIERKQLRAEERLRVRAPGDDR